MGNLVIGGSGCRAPLRILISCCLLCLISSCGSTTKTASPAAADPNPTAWFTEEAHQTGLDFVHTNGRSGKFYPPEIMAPGVALFDFDNDGDLDVFAVQGRPVDGKS